MGKPRAFELRAVAEAIPDSVAFHGWLIGKSSRDDPLDPAVAIPAVTVVTVYLDTDWNRYATFDQHPQHHLPEWERYPYKSLVTWIRMADTLEELRARLHELSPQEAVIDHEVIDRAINEARRTLAPADGE